MKTIYTFIISSVMSLLCLGVSAQHALPVQFTFEGGMNLSNSSWDAGNLDKKARVGFQVGVLVEYPVLDQLYLQSGLYYTRKGAKVEGSRTEGNGDLNRDITVNQMYFQLPLYAAYKIEVMPGTKIVFNAGPYFAQGVAGRTNVPSRVTFWNEHYLAYTDFSSFGGSNSLRRFDFGLGTGVGVELAKILVSLRYELGLNNIGKNDLNYKNRNAALTLGYRF